MRKVLKFRPGKNKLKRVLQSFRSGLSYILSLTWMALVCCLFYKLTMDRKPSVAKNVAQSASAAQPVAQSVQSVHRPSGPFRSVAETGRYEPLSKFVPPPPNPEYIKALQAVASPKQEVLLLLVDRGFSHMAINFYLATIRPNDITNYLILTMHAGSCKEFESHKMNCFFYRGFNSTDVSQFGSEEFLGKMNMRTDMILDALNANFTVLHSDIDMIFFKNPFRVINCARAWCDMAVLMDTHLYNAGFVLVHPTTASKHIYATMQEIAVMYPDVHDQRQLNMITHLEEGLNIHFRLIKLPTDSYQCGYYHYEKPRRYFADTNPPCPECVVAHNNWIVSVEAKVYRQKELHQWMNDDGQYYTSTTHKYMTYNCPLTDTDGDEEVRSLQYALAIATILKRTLILPKFKCNGTECPLNCLVRIDKFDAHFQYREHAFLDHPLVPKSVLDSKDRPFLIETDFVTSKGASAGIDSSVIRYKPKKTDKGMDVDEILSAFGKMDKAILVFHSLYRAFAGFVNPEEHNAWEQKLKDAVERADYRQYTGDQKDARVYCGITANPIPA